MNKREYLLNVLDGNPAKRVPFSFWYHFSGPDARGEDCVQAHLNYYRTYGLDFIKIMSDSIGYPLNITISKASDWYNLKPLPEDHPFFTESVWRCKRINEELKGECCTFYNLFSPFNVVKEREVFTPELQKGRPTNDVLMENIKEDEDAVKYAMNVVAEDIAKLAKMVITEGGCTGVYQSVQGAERGRFTKEEYARIVSPSELNIMKAANEVSKYNILHMCCWAGDANNLDYWKDYPLLVKNWGADLEGLSMVEGKEYFPGSVLLGGLDNRKGYIFCSGTKEEIQAKVRSLVEEMRGHAYILGADCTIPGDVNKERFLWVKEELDKDW